MFWFAPLLKFETFYNAAYFFDGKWIRQFNGFHPSWKPSNPSTFKKSSPHYKSFLCNGGHNPSSHGSLFFHLWTKQMVVYHITFDPMSIHEIPHFGMMGHKNIKITKGHEMWKSQRLELFMCNLHNLCL
jgi:hypothetical protein